METTGHVYESVAGADIVGNASNIQSKKQPSTMQRMKFDDCGIRSNKIVFIRPQDLFKYSNDLIDLSTLLNGTITVVPNLQRECHDYQVIWAADGCLPVSFDIDHLHTKFSKSDKDDYQVLCHARIEYDKKYPESKGKGPLRLGSKITGTPRTTDTVLWTQINTGDSQISPDNVLATARMMPSITATTNAIAEVTYNNLESGSFSDDGSNFEEGDTNFPLIEGNEVIDSTYNSSFMEEDGNYEDLLSGLSFEYSDLTSELAPPANMYNGRGPCLRHGVARRFNTIMEYIAVAGGLDYDYFKRLTSNSNKYARRHINFSVEFGGLPWANITVEEMIRFLGCILKMSVDDRQLGGYCSYFTESISIKMSRDYSVLLHHYPAWA